MFIHTYVYIYVYYHDLAPPGLEVAVVDLQPDAVAAEAPV